MLSQAEVDALVVQHRDFAMRLANKIAKTLPPHVDREELRGASQTGLVMAAQRFDPTQGAAFTTFAYYRVRGAVWDYVRKYARTDAFVRAKASGAAAVDDLLERSIGEAKPRPGDTPADAAEVLGSLLEQAAVAFTVGQCAQSLMGEHAYDSPLANAERSEEGALLRRALDTLPEQSRTLMTRVYFEGATIEEAGATLGLSKSWASRLHARGLALLREQLERESVAA